MLTRFSVIRSGECICIKNSESASQRAAHLCFCGQVGEPRNYFTTEMQRSIASKPSANPAALAVDRKFTASLFSQPRRSSVAPSRLSKNRPKTPPAQLTAEHGQVAAASPGFRRPRRGPPQPLQPAFRPGSWRRPCRVRPAQGRDHARLAAQHLADLRRDRIRGCLSQRRQPHGKQRHRAREPARAKPAGVGQPGLRKFAGGQRRHAQIGRHLRRRSAPAVSPPCPAAPSAPGPAGWQLRRARDRQHRDQRRLPWLIGKDRCGKHQAGRDHRAGNAACRRGRAQLRSTTSAEAAGSGPASRWPRAAIVWPTSGFAAPLRPRKRKHEEQHELRLPDQLHLSHASSYRSDRRTVKALPLCPLRQP